MKRVSFPFVAAVVVIAMVGVGWLIGTRRASQRTSVSVNVPPAASHVNRGSLVYQVYCSSCHGPDGHGDGSSAATLRPPPRDFAVRPWRFTPTLDSIRRVTTEGIPGTGMASFRNLPTTDLEAVVAHVHRLATSGPVVEKPTSEREHLMAAAGFTSLLGTKPPPLTLVDATGHTVKLSDFAGRLVLLHFWGTGCTHCVKEIPGLTALERRHEGRLVVLHICTDEDDVAVAQKVLDETVPGAKALAEANGLGLARYEVQSLPTHWLIAADGSAIGRSSGSKNWGAETPGKLIASWLPDKLE